MSRWRSTAMILSVPALLACGGGNPPGNQLDCRNYERCFYATGGATGSLDPMYGPQGACWVDTMYANRCIQVCRGELAALREAHPDAGCAMLQ